MHYISILTEMLILKGKVTMPRVPRRLRNLNLEAEAEEIEQQDEDMQGPPQELNVGFPEGAQNRSFKIICEFVISF